MPWGYPVGLGAMLLLDEWMQEERALQRADDDGMIERYVRLDGIQTPRMLSHAEVHALRHDLSG